MNKKDKNEDRFLKFYLVPVSITLLRIIVSDPQVHPDYIDYKIDFKVGVQ